MGNRALITTRAKELSVYLHWNGGRDSVEPLLDYCNMHGYRPPEKDDYGWARMCQVMGNFFGGGLSVGVSMYDRYALWALDNGVYVIEDWKIVDRIVPPGFEEQRHIPRAEMLKAYDDAMPADQRLGRLVEAVEVDAASLRVGDKVWVRDSSEKPLCRPVLGFKVQKHACEGAFPLPYVEIQDSFLGAKWPPREHFVREGRVWIEPREEGPGR